MTTSPWQTPSPRSMEHMDAAPALCRNGETRTAPSPAHNNRLGTSQQGGLGAESGARLNVLTLAVPCPCGVKQLCLH